MGKDIDIKSLKKDALKGVKKSEEERKQKKKEKEAVVNYKVNNKKFFWIAGTILFVLILVICWIYKLYFDPTQQGFEDMIHVL